jgi:hypothetical protein
MSSHSVPSLRATNQKDTRFSAATRPHRVWDSIVVRLKFLREGSTRKAAAVEPFLSVMRRMLNELARRREIEWRYIKWTESRHNANIDLVREPLKITHELPRAYCRRAVRSTKRRQIARNPRK